MCISCVRAPWLTISCNLISWYRTNLEPRVNWCNLPLISFFTQDDEGHWVNGWYTWSSTYKRRKEKDKMEEGAGLEWQGREDKRRKLEEGKRKDKRRIVMKNEYMLPEDLWLRWPLPLSLGPPLPLFLFLWGTGSRVPSRAGRRYEGFSRRGTAIHCTLHMATVPDNIFVFIANYSIY